MRSARVRAPELVGRGGWINTGGRELSLAQLRGSFVLLDFWTFCCVNCLHVLDELRPLERQYADVLVTVGVHSPKFLHEADHDAVVAAVERYDVAHPVLDDPDLETWRRYAVRAWPTLALVDPEGYVVAQYSGEGHAHALAATLAELVPVSEAKGLLHRGFGPYQAPEPEATSLRFPSKVVSTTTGSLLVADAGHHRLVELGPDAATVLRTIGSGRRGFLDGDAGTAAFSEPHGVGVLPADVSHAIGYDLVVADTVNHALRGVSTVDGEVRTVAGTGRQWMQGEPTSGRAREVSLSSPWDVLWWPAVRRVVVAMAGVHQLWAFDPVDGTVEVLAGTSHEGLLDGDADHAWLAQPSGLAVSPDGATLWFVDAETSSLRRWHHGVVHSAVGHGLFDFGHVDGPAADALMQHPLGLTVLPDGSVVVADTYNGAVRRYHPATDQVSTLVADLAEPADVLLVPHPQRGHVLVVVESAAHRLTPVVVDAEVAVPPAVRRTPRPPLEVAPGEVDLEVVFEPPPGQHLDERYGPATHLVVSASPEGLLLAGTGSGAELRRSLVVSGTVPDGVLHVSVRAASCDDPQSPDAAPFPACHLHQQDWGVPVTVGRGGGGRVVLVLAGREPGSAD